MGWKQRKSLPILSSEEPTAFVCRDNGLNSVPLQSALWRYRAHIHGGSAWLGEFYDLGGETDGLSFYPLADLTDDSDLVWANSWVEKLCKLGGLDMKPQHRNAVADAMKLMQGSPRRTLTDFLATVQNKEVRSALEVYTLSGPLGRLLDAEKDGLRDGRMMVFEMDNLMKYGDGNSKATVALLLYLFRRIQKKLDGRPTLNVLDEAWVYLRDELFREYLRDWLKTLRK